jgi:hypothetical protein
MSNSNTDDDFAPLPQFKETRNSNKNWVVITLVKVGSEERWRVQSPPFPYGRPNF